MQVSLRDIEFLQKAGTIFKPLGSLEAPSYPYRRLSSDCGYLQEDNSCAAHEDPDRPKTCQEFEPGSPSCAAFRVKAGVPTDFEVIEKGRRQAQLSLATLAYMKHPGNQAADVWQKDVIGISAKGARLSTLALAELSDFSALEF